MINGITSIHSIITELSKLGARYEIGIIQCMTQEQVVQLLERISWAESDIQKGLHAEDGEIQLNGDVRLTREAIRERIDWTIRGTRASLNPPHKIIK